MVGIKQIQIPISADTIELHISVPEMPYGILIGTSDESYGGANTVIRVSGIWTTYQGGQYAGGRFVATTGASGGQDHWALDVTRLFYDETNHELVVKPNTGKFMSDRTYYLWYFTIPF